MGVSSKGSQILIDALAAGVDPTLGGMLWVDAPAAGEVLCPFGMHGQSKLVSDLLADAKVAACERQNVPVVHASPRGPVLWVAGVRFDERVRCTPVTRYALELTLRTHGGKA